MAERRFLLFSGHNDRAVVALCRFFEQARLPFVIVAAGKSDAIHRTSWAPHVVFNRQDSLLTVPWLRNLCDSLGGELVYCPTTEFINHFVLTNRASLEGCGLHLGLPEPAIYAALTGKRSSQALMTSLCADLHLPGTQPQGQWHAPCVLKPHENVSEGRVLYPLLCRTDSDLQQALDGLTRSSYFSQDFITGQSHYLCAYLARDGEFASFWQVNLMQQGGGKSIVLAKPCGRPGHPGLDERQLFRGLHAHGYHGAFMLEVIESHGQLYYIEVNPRFWGPLQLALDVCPDILCLFAREQGFDTPAIPAQRPENAWYAWAYGAHQVAGVVHPAGQVLSSVERERLLAVHDVYARDDTRALQACH